MKKFICLSIALVCLNACQIPYPSSQPAPQTPNKLSTSALNAFSYGFQKHNQLPASLIDKVLPQAQAYADLVSHRRKIDLFQMHSQAVGLKLDSDTFILSFLGTAKTRSDLNLELRTLVSGSKLGMNLNYSGPVTRGLKTQAKEDTPQLDLKTPKWEFELIMGLPGEGVVKRYESVMLEQAKYLRYRYQSQPFQFDDGPLVYAIRKNGVLEGFVFMNQRNLLILCERKYGDVQSVLVIGTKTQLLGSYTLIAFNPKSESANKPLDLKYETHERFGTLVEIGSL